MKRCLTAVLAAALAAALLAAAAPTSSRKKESPVARSARRALPGVVLIEWRPLGTKDEQVVGAGFVVDARGYVLTARHLLGGSQENWVRHRDGYTEISEIVAEERATDLALLWITDHKSWGGLSLLKFRDTPLEVGETAVLIGAPAKLGWTVTSGVVSRLKITFTAGDEESRGFQASPAINPGSSGGPLLDEDGAVIGMAQAMIGGRHGLGFYRDVAACKKFLARFLPRE